VFSFVVVKSNYLFVGMRKADGVFAGSLSICCYNRKLTLFTKDSTCTYEINITTTSYDDDVT